MSEETIHNDEPSYQDTLNRDKFAGAFVKLATSCETPFVVGLYGTWGIGKTSLMRQIEAIVATRPGIRTVWFDSWQHQFDETPALALLHSMVASLNLGEDGRKLLTLIAGALGSALLKVTTSLSFNDIEKLAGWYEDERFLVRERQVRLRHLFRSLLDKATQQGRCRIVFFIDDLDRCMPEQILRMLEALKLYLNLPNCIYFLAVDRAALESSIRNRYKDLEVQETDYLDKIVQLPFEIPPIPGESMENFIAPLLPRRLQTVKGMLVRGLGDNPRQVKRFVNTLILNTRLASQFCGHYNLSALALLLLIQYRQPRLFRLVASQPNLLLDLQANKKQRQDVFDKYVATDIRLRGVLEEHPLPKDTPVEAYVYLTQLARVSAPSGYGHVILKDVGPNKINVIKIVREVTGLGLKEAIDLVDNPPSKITEAIDKATAEIVRGKLAQAGALAEVE